MRLALLYLRTLHPLLLGLFCGQIQELVSSWSIKPSSLELWIGSDEPTSTVAASKLRIAQER